jgi:hypothetical protein
MANRISIYAGVLALLGSFFSAVVGQVTESANLGLETIRCDIQKEPPVWALYERQLIETLNRAGVEFYNKYVLPDGTLEWKDRYQGGMNSSDDAYEAFRGYSLTTALGGSGELDKLHRQVWEGITRQFTRYGQIYREFDSNWDWMHHGEGYVSLYPMGMVEPDDPVFRDRAVRFAAMYIGDDPESPNWDPNLKMMRSVMNGSRGPKMEWNKRDWTPTNSNLVSYHLPFSDIPGVDSSAAWINDYPDNDKFAELVKAMSDRMAKGDVPINLTSTPLIANAYLYTGDPRYVQWVKDYLGMWEELTRQNNGITPDNVGLSGKIGEYTGHWWGGYYGWMWPRGGMDVVLAELTAAKVATLLTGDNRWAELPRSQMAVMRERGELRNGVPFMPDRHDQRGWHHFVPEPGSPYVHLWFLSHDEKDWREIERLAEAQLSSSGSINNPDLEWAYFVKGRNPEFPERAFNRDFKTIAQKLELVRNEHGDPESWIDGKWLGREPMMTDNLVRLSVGGLPVHKRGEMLHAQVRYFDGERQRSGLPPDVAALVTRIERDWIEIEVVNLSPIESRHLVVQGGAYGEHQIVSVEYPFPANEQPSRRTRNRPQTSPLQKKQDVGANAFEVILAPSAGSTLRLHLERYVNQPTYNYP